MPIIEERKRKALFYTIKNEQTLLKKERKKLIQIRSTPPRHSRHYRSLSKQIDAPTQMIERKQRDADYIKSMHTSH